MNPSIKHFIAGLSAIIIWGFFSIPIRFMREYAAHDILFWRILFSLASAAILILLFNRAALRNDIAFVRSLPRKKLRALVLLNLVAGFLIAGNWFTYIYAVNAVSLQSAAFAYLICPLMTAFGGVLFFGEVLSSKQKVALGLTFLALILLGQGSLLELTWSIIIAGLYALYVLSQRRAANLNRLNLLAFHLIVACFMLIPMYLVVEVHQPVEAKFWIMVSVISVFFTVIPMVLSLYAISSLPSSTYGMMIYLNPIIAFALAFFYFHESVGSIQIYAYSILLAAVLLFNENFLRKIFSRGNRN